MVKKICVQCGRAFIRNNPAKSQRYFCSRECYYQWMKLHPDEFITLGFKGKHHTKESRIKISMNNRGPRYGEYVCKECGKPFKTLQALSSHRANIKRHELKGCIFCGKPLLRYQEKYCSAKCMGAHFSQLRRGKRVGERVLRVLVECGWCGGEVARRPKYLKNVKHVFCSKDCQKRWFGKRMKRDNPFRCRHHSKKTRDLLREMTTKQFGDKEKRERHRIAMLEAMNREEVRKKLSDGSLKAWREPSYIKKQMIARNVRPNKLELYTASVLQKHFPNQWVYTGDGKAGIVIGGMVPDFAHNNGKKKVIEVFGDYWHRNDDPQERIGAFRKHGYDCLVIWERELKGLSEDDVANKIRQFEQEF